MLTVPVNLSALIHSKSYCGGAGNEVRAYWDKFEPLKKNPVLLEKLIGHKAQGIVTAYRYASGKHYHTTTAFLCGAGKHQEGLDTNKVSYKGENSLKESCYCLAGRSDSQSVYERSASKAEVDVHLFSVLCR